MGYEKKNYSFANLCGVGSSLDTNQHNNKSHGRKKNYISEGCENPA
jgi:hypothetical protein